MLAIVVPCFNEEFRLDILYWKETIRTLDECHWFFVDDGSTDQTTEVLKSLEANNVYFLRLNKNLGKGAAIRSGLLTAIDSKVNVYTKVGYLDADGAFNLNDIVSMVKESELKLSYDSIFRTLIASRVKLAGREIERTAYRHYLGRIIYTYLSLGWSKAPYDPQSGFKIFALDSNFRQAISKPFQTRWFFDIELILRLQEIDSREIWEISISNWKEIPGSSISMSKYFSILREILLVRRLVKNFQKQRSCHGLN